MNNLRQAMKAADPAPSQYRVEPKRPLPSAEELNADNESLRSEIFRLKNALRAQLAATQHLVY